MQEVETELPQKAQRHQFHQLTAYGVFKGMQAADNEPDYIINSGGVINIIDDISGREYNKENAMKNTAKIYDTCKKVFEIAKREGIPTYKAADKMAEERIAAVGKIKTIFNRKKPPCIRHVWTAGAIKLCKCSRWVCSHIQPMWNALF